MGVICEECDKREPRRCERHSSKPGLLADRDEEEFPTAYVRESAADFEEEEPDAS